MTMFVRLRARPRPRLLSPAAFGVAAMMLTVLIWAGFALSLRGIGGSGLTPVDIGLIRFGLPVLALLPWLPGRWARLRRVRPLDAAMIVIGGGAPFFLIAAQGAAQTSATHVAATIAGGAPLAVALIGRGLDGQSIGVRRGCAFALILVGVGVLFPLSGAMWEGALWLIAASGLWGTYSYGLRRAGLDAIGSTLLLCLPSFILLGALAASGVVDTHLDKASFADLAPFLLVQGLGVGVLGGLAYAAAIRRLGAGPSAAIGALAPVVTAGLAMLVLHAPFHLMILIGAGLVTAGVALATRFSPEATSCSRN